MKTILSTVCAVAGLAALAPAVGAQTLRYGDLGQTHVYSRTQQDHVSQTVNGNEQTNDITGFLRFRSTIDQKSDSTLTVAIVSDSVDVKAGNAGGPDLAGLTGKTVTVEMTPQGEVLDVALPDSLPTGADQIDLRGTFRGFYPHLPEGEVSTGDTWADTTNLKTENNGLDISIQRIDTYTAKGQESYAGHDGMRFDYTSEIKLDGTGNQGGADISLSGTGTGNGTVYFQPDPGVYLGGTEDSEVKMDAYVSAGEQNLLIPIVQKRTESTEIVE